VSRVTTTITVGELSRLSHLPVKTLHHYHEVGVLVPAVVDPATGYRRYTLDQVETAHLARRLRDVRMPLTEMAAVLAAGDPAEREAGIAAHLERLQRELAEAATAVTSLRSLLATPPAEHGITLRDAPAQPAVALAGVVDREAVGEWCATAYPRLYAAVGTLGAVPDGPGAALYDPGWFEEGGGRMTAFVPVRPEPGADVPSPEAHGPAVPAGRVVVVTLPAQRLAVALHAGAFEDLDLTYGRLGRHVLGRGIGADGPLRETYLVSPADADDPNAFRTEIGWPVVAGGSDDTEGEAR
jgi:DNA-binding transcriptional MerR regulator